jgi:hypothetical protein
MRFNLGGNNYLTTQPLKFIVTLSDDQPIRGATVSVSVQPPSQAAQAIRLSKWISVNGDTVPDPENVAKAKATYKQPSAMVSLYDDGLHGDGAANDGVYANTYIGTSVAGTYAFSAYATGTSSIGGTFTRQLDLSTYIAPNPVPNSSIFMPLVTR